MNTQVTLEAGAACLGEITLSFDGQIDGWCWYPSRPTERAVVEVLLDGVIMRAAIAGQGRPDLRTMGMGDGFCGFRLALPQGALDQGTRHIVEVRERRRKQLIGRLITGARDGLAPERARLDAVTQSLSRTSRRLDRLAAGKSVPLANRFGELGVALLAYTPGRGQDLSLAAAHAYLNVIPSTDLGYATAPRVSLIVAASPNPPEDAARLREAACVFHPAPAEFILIHATSQPLSALLPTRLRHLRLVRADSLAGAAAALNEAALQARGEWLGFVASAELVPTGLTDACQTTAPATLYAAETLLAHLAAHPAIIAQRPVFPPPPQGGLFCLISRSDFLAVGGLEAASSVQAMWMGFMEKAACLLAIQPWRKLRPSAAIGA